MKNKIKKFKKVVISKKQLSTLKGGLLSGRLDELEGDLSWHESNCDK
ncbi:hypothetical protein [uncultured Microscilla sp.]|nr:hypothetical protein [uncultured Microscilla sp.]